MAVKNPLLRLRLSCVLFKKKQITILSPIGASH
jgi:hypothetical protein